LRDSGSLTGYDISETELKKAGERIWNLERIYNLNEGVEEDLPLQRLFDEDLADVFEGVTKISKDRFLSARSLYYRVRGWNEKGVPSPEKVKELDI
jgi:aldehyde:ferredoxin oxidoreductase